MRITDVRTMRLTGPDPHGIGGQARMYSFLIVRVDTDAGIHGIGEALAFPGVEDAIDAGREWIVGRDPLSIGPIVRGLTYGALPGPNPDEPAGPLMSSTATVVGPPAWAAAGVEMALWDLAGKALETPAHVLLGGAYRDAVRVYLDRSGVADPTDLSAWRGLGERVVAEGFDWLKLDLEQIAPDMTLDPWSRQISSAQLDAIVERVAAVRDAIGPAVDLGIDAHFCFDVESAIRAAIALAPLRPRWLEDPVPITSPTSLARVRAASPVPIAAGEQYTAEQFRLAFEAGAIDIAHPDVLFVGGLGEARNVGVLADLWYTPLAFHTNGSAVAAIATAHVASTIPGLLGMEYHFYDATWVGEVARRDVPLFVAGEVPLTDAPGLGLELDDELCRRYLAPGESFF